MAERGVRAFFALVVFAGLIVVFFITPLNPMRPVAPSSRSDPLDQLVEEVFTEAGIADEIDEKFEGLDGAAALGGAQDLLVDGVRRVDREVLVEYLRSELRMIRAVPPGSCVAIAMGELTPSVVEDVMAAMRAMTEAERRERLTLQAELIKASLTEQVLRDPLTRQEQTTAERTFLALFTENELRRLEALAAPSGSGVSDEAGCRVARMMYARILTLPAQDLGLVVAFIVASVMPQPA